ncbi:hypothetical protein [Levilactobacillus brevis]|uniref:hypothetical protein n=1 Tax=Levilactobacillus brevis TaxID=1580 RepID=UPI001C1ECB3F|nr:hypothetical protein [Levilactobacillus brevis]MBU7558848.1 hypothetical protein [Levilactobacillus brevis]MCE6010455.1 hypothetical protein [Levilactobacillus brevis]MCE6025017.1 hypothetical protein [Levilactobacillus brevis]MCE6035883.1 hypothetical protein [Levilactobacillus brevis]
MFIYITYDTDGFITAYQNTEADGITAGDYKAITGEAYVAPTTQATTTSTTN